MDLHGGDVAPIGGEGVQQGAGGAVPGAATGGTQQSHARVRTTTDGTEAGGVAATTSAAGAAAGRLKP